ncbi:MAG: hypothetical protein KBD96_01390 [Brachymonas sp.]|jgi:hypothetical protein|nr:hypothetical protein [Brachymonas sp.]MBP7246906.1 hypothetical protein [Brachymonas sp.]MBP7744342.1 hypothetical protein [Brachymonas sp.]MBP8596694.1 hypothetical protein [Brachymonas sp.]MBP9589665.1 hypothetical protein [Brachymonas sp.]
MSAPSRKQAAIWLHNSGKAAAKQLAAMHRQAPRLTLLASCYHVAQYRAASACCLLRFKRRWFILYTRAASNALFPRKRKCIAARSAAVNFRLRGNDKRLRFYPKLEYTSASPSIYFYF